MVIENAGDNTCSIVPVPECSSRLFALLLVIEDLEPRDAALQMAIDRALLETTKLPVLRLYRWSAPCVTIGYFESQQDAEKKYPGMNIVRRWTGGGSVLHGTDTPYSLIVPRSEPFASVKPRESYCLIHESLAKALRETLPEVITAKDSAPKTSAACFENPVTGDLLVGNNKIAGAGQRRTRHGFLHQGSIQIDKTGFPQPLKFASLLAHTIQTVPLPLTAKDLALSF